MHKRWFVVMLPFILLTLFMAACSMPTHWPWTSPAMTPTATASATPTPTEVSTSPPVMTPTPAVITLTWWTPIWFSPRSQDAAGEFLQQRIREFEARYPHVHVDTRVKPAYGKGSIKDYLQGAYKVAPSLIPDVVVLDMQDVPTLAALGIFHPLDAISDTVQSAFYPFVGEAGWVNGAWLAVQFETNFYHVAYPRDVVTNPPGTWEALLNSEITYLSWLFSSEDVASDIVLTQYAALGGPLPRDKAVPLDEQALLTLFSLYDQAAQRGIFPAEVLEPQTPDSLWGALRDKKAMMVDVSARRFIREGAQQLGVDAAPIPTWDGKPRTLANGWGLAITTTDERRHSASLAFVQWLLDPATLGPWSQRAGRVPTRPDALHMWDMAPMYRDLLDRLLENSTPYPPHASVIDIRRALARGLKAVLVDHRSPEDAVKSAQETYSP